MISVGKLISRGDTAAPVKVRYAKKNSPIERRF
jgi:hypothetical protein